VIVGLAAVLACVPACGKKDSGKLRVGIVTNCTADFWSICEAGANKAAEKYNVELQFRQPVAAFDASEQTPIVEAWAKQKLDGIAVSVIDPENQTKDLTRIGKEVPFIALDNDAPESGRLAYIGIDNYEAGKAVGRLVKKALPKGGTVAVFIGSTKSANGKARTQGVLDELAGEKNAPGVDATHPMKADLKGKKYGNYFLVDGEAKEDGKPTNAQATAAGVLGRVKGLPDLCMVGLYAYNPPAILKDAKAKSMANEIKIIGFDEDWDTLAGIAAGEIEATVVQDPFQYGYKAVEAFATKNYDIKSIPYRIVTKNGGPTEKVNGVDVENLKEADFTPKLHADIDSVKKK
jgi:ribose transport system substrate-binding protein